MPPAKRPGPSDVVDTSTAADGGANPKLKLPRLDRGPEEFSSVVKNKLQTYTRTGQACDRCKVRKIRCDALPEGCSHCTNQNLECYVTDRVSGRTERRGYLQQLERDKAAMVNHIRELEQLLADNGIQVSPWQGTAHHANYPPDLVLDSMGNPIRDHAESKDQWKQMGSLWVKNYKPKQTASGSSSSTYTRHSLVESRPNESYLGVSADSEPLSSIKGTKLSVLGTTIDITSFDAPDMDEPPPGTPIGSPLYNKSVMAFMQTILSMNPPVENVELPSRQDAFTYVEWYFLMISPFLPVLHKPSFLQLLTKIYDDPSFKPSVPEQVIVHMVFATIYFQYGIRNREEPEKHAKLNDLSNKHYHYSLGKFFDLAVSRSVTAAQALAMLVAHTRNFPKPGCSSTIAQFSLYKAIELGLHRAVKVPGGGTNLDNEVRKRVWWAILGVLVTLNGRLGRPMPITLDEFDVEFPIAIPDECLGEEGVVDSSKVGHCNYQIGLMGFRTVPLYIEMYRNIYGVRRDPTKYVDVVRELEEGVQAIYDSLPVELNPEACNLSEKVFALYAQAFRLEFAICLRHPSVCMTTDPKFCADNTRVCEESAQKLLKIVGELLRMKSLDTTWYQLAVYVAAIFSTLVAQWERRSTISAHQLNTLRAEMMLWLEVIGEIGRLLGTGTRLTTEIGVIIQRTLGWIEHAMDRKIGASSEQASSISNVQNSTSTPLGSETPNEKSGTTTATNGNGFYDTPLVGSTTPYPNLGYDESAINGGPVGPTSQLSQQNGTPGTGFDPTNGTAYQIYTTVGPGSGPLLTTPTLGSNVPSNMDQTGTSVTNPLIAFASQATQHVMNAGPGSQQSTVGHAEDDWRRSTAAQQAQQLLAATAHNTGIMTGNTWQDWAAAMADSQDRFSASTLLTLGGGRAGDHMNQQVDGGQNDAMNAAVAAAGLGISLGGVGSNHTASWPLLLFPDGTNSGGG
ncbi:transcriptional activator protein acu-15 [Rhypophila sp. PSN 637]